MARRGTRNTRGKIVDAAWKLFYRQGYEQTTVEEILTASGTSRGTFYHYFEGKDALLSSLAELLDEQYEKLMETMDPEMDRFEQLMYLNRELFAMVESSVSLDLLARLYATQLTAVRERSLMDRNRIYYRLLRRIILEGQERGELRSDVTVSEMLHVYALLERALIYDWCLSQGEYSLAQYGRRMMPRFFASYRTVGREGGEAEKDEG